LQDIKNKSITAFLWDFTGKFANHGITFIISIFLARLLSPEDFGLLGMVMVIITIAQSFIDFGFSEALVQKKDPTEEQYSTIFFINLILGVIFAITISSFSGLVAKFYNRTELIKMTKVLTILFVIIPITLIPRVRLQKELKFKYLTKTRIFAALLSGILGVILAFAGYGVWALIWRTISSNLIEMLLLIYFERWAPKPIFKLSSIKEIWEKGYKFFSVGTINTIYNRIDVVVIGKLFSPSSLGYYFRAKSFNMLILQYSSESISRVLFPAFSLMQHDRQKVRITLNKSLSILSFITFGLVGLFWVTGGDLIILLFSDKWIPSIPYFKIMLLFGYSNPVCSVLSPVISGLGNASRYLRLETVKKIFLSIAMPIGFYFGIDGYLIAMVFVGFFSVIISMWYVDKEIDYPLSSQLGDVFKYLIPMFLALMPVWILDLLLIKVDSYFINILSRSCLFIFAYKYTNQAFNTSGLRLVLNAAHNSNLKIKNRFTKV